MTLEVEVDNRIGHSTLPVGNEPDTEHFPQSAYDYWRPLYEQAHAQDLQDRPVTMVCCQNDYTRDITTRTIL